MYVCVCVGRCVCGWGEERGKPLSFRSCGIDFEAFSNEVSCDMLDIYRCGEVRSLVSSRPSEVILHFA